MYSMTTKAKRLRIEFGSIILRAPELNDETEFIARSKGSRASHKGLVNPPAEPGSFREYVALNDSETNKVFLVEVAQTGEIAGATNLSQIFLKGFCSAYLGYYLFDGFRGRGLMTDAITALLNQSFKDFGLHRIEANIQPWNDASIRLVKRCGFTKEGFSRKYLEVRGERRDHERWAIIRDDWIQMNNQ